MVSVSSGDVLRRLDACGGKSNSAELARHLRLLKNDLLRRNRAGCTPSGAAAEGSFSMEEKPMLSLRRNSSKVFHDNIAPRNRDRFSSRRGEAAAVTAVSHGAIHKGNTSPHAGYAAGAAANDARFAPASNGNSSRREAEALLAKVPALPAWNGEHLSSHVANAPNARKQTADLRRPEPQGAGKQSSTQPNTEKGSLRGARTVQRAAAAAPEPAVPEPPEDGDESGRQPRCWKGLPGCSSSFSHEGLNISPSSSPLTGATASDGSIFLELLRKETVTTRGPAEEQTRGRHDKNQMSSKSRKSGAEATQVNSKYQYVETQAVQQRLRSMTLKHTNLVRLAATYRAKNKELGQKLLEAESSAKRVQTDLHAARQKIDELENSTVSKAAYDSLSAEFALLKQQQQHTAAACSDKEKETERLEAEVKELKQRLDEALSAAAVADKTDHQDQGGRANQNKECNTREKQQEDKAYQMQQQQRELEHLKILNRNKAQQLRQLQLQVTELKEQLTMERKSNEKQQQQLVCYLRRMEALRRRRTQTDAQAKHYAQTLLLLQEELAGERAAREELLQLLQLQVPHAITELRKRMQKTVSLSPSSSSSSRAFSSSALIPSASLLQPPSVHSFPSRSPISSVSCCLGRLPPPSSSSSVHSSADRNHALSQAFVGPANTVSIGSSCSSAANPVAEEPGGSADAVGRNTNLFLSKNKTDERKSRSSPLGAGAEARHQATLAETTSTSPPPCPFGTAAEKDRQPVTTHANYDFSICDSPAPQRRRGAAITEADDAKANGYCRTPLEITPNKRAQEKPRCSSGGCASCSSYSSNRAVAASSTYCSTTYEDQVPSSDKGSRCCSRSISRTSSGNTIPKGLDNKIRDYLKIESNSNQGRIDSTTATHVSLALLQQKLETSLRSVSRAEKEELARNATRSSSPSAAGRETPRKQKHGHTSQMDSNSAHRQQRRAPPCHRNGGTYPRASACIAHDQRVCDTMPRIPTPTVAASNATDGASLFASTTRFSASPAAPARAPTASDDAAYAKLTGERSARSSELASPSTWRGGQVALGPLFVNEERGSNMAGKGQSHYANGERQDRETFCVRRTRAEDRDDSKSNIAHEVATGRQHNENIWQPQDREQWYADAAERGAHQRARQLTRRHVSREGEEKAVCCTAAETVQTITVTTADPVADATDLRAAGNIETIAKAKAELAGKAAERRSNSSCLGARTPGHCFGYVKNSRDADFSCHTNYFEKHKSCRTACAAQQEQSYFQHQQAQPKRPLQQRQLQHDEGHGEPEKQNHHYEQCYHEQHQSQQQKQEVTRQEQEQHQQVQEHVYDQQQPWHQQQQRHGYANDSRHQRRQCPAVPCSGKDEFAGESSRSSCCRQSNSQQNYSVPVMNHPRRSDRPGVNFEQSCSTKCAKVTVVNASNYAEEIQVAEQEAVAVLPASRSCSPSEVSRAAIPPAGLRKCPPATSGLRGVAGATAVAVKAPSDGAAALSSGPTDTDAAVEQENPRQKSSGERFAANIAAALRQQQQHERDEDRNSEVARVFRYLEVEENMTRRHEDQATNSRQAFARCSRKSADSCLSEISYLSAAYSIGEDLLETEMQRLQATRAADAASPVSADARGRDSVSTTSTGAAAVYDHSRHSLHKADYYGPARYHKSEGDIMCTLADYAGQTEEAAQNKRMRQPTTEGAYLHQVTKAAPESAHQRFRPVCARRDEHADVDHIHVSTRNLKVSTPRTHSLSVTNQGEVAEVTKIRSPPGDDTSQTHVPRSYPSECDTRNSSVLRDTEKVRLPHRAHAAPTQPHGSGKTSQLTDCFTRCGLAHEEHTERRANGYSGRREAKREAPQGSDAEFTEAQRSTQLSKTDAAPNDSSRS